MKIDRLKEEYIGALLPIEQSCFGKSAWSREGFESELHKPENLFLCALEEKTVVGCIAADNAAGQGFISKVMVAPQYRRRGVAKALLSALVEFAEAQKMEELTLEVRASNAPAIALYEAAGFEKIGNRRRFYHDPSEDAVIMTKKL